MKADSAALTGSNETKPIQLGVFRYAVNIPGNQYDTQGQCISYEDGNNNNSEGAEVAWQVYVARVAGIIAPCCGVLLVLLVLATQCCCTIPCSSPMIVLMYMGAEIGTAFSQDHQQVRIAQE